MLNQDILVELARRAYEEGFRMGRTTTTTEPRLLSPCAADRLEARLLEMIRETFAQTR